MLAWASAFAARVGVGAKQTEDVPWARLTVDHGYRAGCGQDLVDERSALGVVPPQDDAACTECAPGCSARSQIRRSDTKRIGGSSGDRGRYIHVRFHPALAILVAVSIGRDPREPDVDAHARPPQKKKVTPFAWSS